MLNNGNAAENKCENGVSIDYWSVNWCCYWNIVLSVRYLHIVSVDMQSSMDEEATEKEALCDLLWCVRGEWRQEGDGIIVFNFIVSSYVNDDLRSEAIIYPLDLIVPHPIPIQRLSISFALTKKRWVFQYLSSSVLFLSGREISFLFLFPFFSNGVTNRL